MWRGGCGDGDDVMMKRRDSGVAVRGISGEREGSIQKVGGGWNPSEASA